MKVIDSPQNTGYKTLQRLVSEPRFRRSSGLCWLEGERLVEAGLTAPGAETAWLVVSQTAATAAAEAAVGEGSRVAGFMRAAPEVWVLADRLFAQLSQVQADQGVGLVLPVPASALSSSPQPGQDWVVLDRLQDPGNLGSLLRTAAAAGIGCAVLLEGSTEAFSPKALRAGMGAQFAMQVVESVTEAAWSDWVAAAPAGLQVVQTVAPGLAGSISLYAEPSPLATPGALVWAFGQEGAGLSEGLRALEGLRISIPQVSAVESLNVAAAAAICLFERRRLALAAQL